MRWTNNRRSNGRRGACRCEELEARDDEVERIAVQARHKLAQASHTQACYQGTLIPMVASATMVCKSLPAFFATRKSA